MMLPIDMPEAGHLSVTLEPDEVDYLSPETGGRIGAISAGLPIWRLDVQLQNMSHEAADVWVAWRQKLRGAKRPFVARDTSRLFPRLYEDGFSRMTRADGTPFLGAASGWSQAIDVDEYAVLTLTGLPRGLKLSLRDYVGFRWTAAGSPPGSFDRRALVRVVEAAEANASGTIAVKIEPAVPTLVVPGGAVAHLDRPGCIMRQVVQETKLSPYQPGLVPAGGTIVAVEDLQP